MKTLGVTGNNKAMRSIKKGMDGRILGLNGVCEYDIKNIKNNLFCFKKNKLYVCVCKKDIMETTPYPLRIYIPFTSDYGFKVTFGNAHNLDFLKRALQALIQSEVPIRQIWFDKISIEGQTNESRGGLLDIYCRDDSGNYFIVEMQLGYFKHMIQRLKFYGYHKMDTEVRKGDFKFDKLPKIYCVGILGYNLLDGERYRTVVCLKDEDNRIIDEQMVFVIVELEKFDKIPENCTTDLDKLIYTMKEAHKIASSLEQPAFMQEDWIVAALHELDTRALSPERRASLSIFLAKELSERHQQAELAAELEFGKLALVEMKEALQARKQEIEARDQEIEARKRELELEKTKDLNFKRITIRTMMTVTDWTDEQIALELNLPLDLVQQVRAEK